MNLILILALLQSAEPSKPAADLVRAFLDGDASARGELMRLGAAAILPLRKEREKAPEKIDPMILELKKGAGYPMAVPIPDQFIQNSGLVISLGLNGQTSLGQFTADFNERGVPFFSDRFDTRRLKATKGMIHARSPQQLIDDLCVLTGLDYGYFHNFIVIGVPERLWLQRIGDIPELTPGARTQARACIAKLADESMAARDEAMSELHSMGPAVLPLLEEGLKRKDATSFLCDALIRQLRAPAGGAFGPSVCVRQKLSEEDDIVRKHLASSKPRLSFRETTFQAIAADLAKFQGVECDIAEPHRALTVSVTIRGQSLLDLLSVATQCRDLDFAIRDRKVVIDTKVVLEKLVK